jgi:hypothetical protein
MVRDFRPRIVNRLRLLLGPFGANLFLQRVEYSNRELCCRGFTASVPTVVLLKVQLLLHISKSSKSDSTLGTTRFLQYNPRDCPPQHNIQEFCLVVVVTAQSPRSEVWFMSRFPCVDNAVGVESSISTGRQVVRDEMMQSQTSSRRSSFNHSTCYCQSRFPQIVEAILEV